MRRVSSPITFVEHLEGRRLLADATPLAGEGFDIQLVSDLENDTTPAIGQTIDPVKRVPMADGFKWFDGTSNQDLIAHGGQLEYIMVDGWNVWPRDMSGAIRTGEPSEENTRWLAHYAAARTSTLIVDIENWGMDIRYYSKTVVDQNIARFQRIVSWLREEQPNLKIGIYSLFPVSDLYNTTQYSYYSQSAIDPVTGAWYRVVLPGVSNAFAKLQNTNAYLSELSQSVDYIFPALYTSSTDVDQWVRYATSTIYEARRYGKPVIPFIMPTYHHASGLNQAVVTQSVWQAQLDLLPEIADGGIIWTDPLAPVGANEYWIQMAIAKINGVGNLVGAAMEGLSSIGGRTDLISDDDDAKSGDELIDELL